MIYAFFAIYIPKYHFFSKTTDQIDMKFHMYFSYDKALRTKQDGASDAYSFA